MSDGDPHQHQPTARETGRETDTSVAHARMTTTMTIVVRSKVRELETHLLTHRPNILPIEVTGATIKAHRGASIDPTDRIERGADQQTRSLEATGSGRGLQSFVSVEQADGVRTTLIIGRRMTTTAALHASAASGTKKAVTTITITSDPEGPRTLQLSTKKMVIAQDMPEKMEKIRGGRPELRSSRTKQTHSHRKVPRSTNMPWSAKLAIGSDR